MTQIRYLSAGLMAIAMLTISVVGQESFAAERLTARSEHASGSHAGHWIFSRAPASAPSAQSEMSPHNEPGGVCDQGDNPMIC